MDENDVIAPQNARLAESIQAKRTLAVAHDKAKSLAAQMEAVAACLRVFPANISVGSYNLLDPDEITKIIADIETAEQESAKVNDAVTDLGRSVPRLK
ncbi:hypothetical protein BH10ACI4_BH10ACI4_07950 [soil metagenome]